MKNKMRIISLMLLLVFLLSACSKQVEVKSDLTQTSGKSILNEIDQFQYVNKDPRLSLKLDSIQVKLNNNLKGEMAVVYAQTLSNEAIKTTIDANYDSNERAAFEAAVVENVVKVTTELAKERVMLSKYLNKEQLSTFDEVSKNYEAFSKDVQAGNYANLDDMLNGLNAQKDILDQYVNENIVPLMKQYAIDVANIQTQDQMLNVLKTAYTNASDSFGTYNEGQDYSGLYTSIVKAFNQELLQHAKVTNNYEALITWADKTIVAKMNGSIPSLPFFKDAGKPKDLEEKIKSGDTSVAYLMDANTYTSLKTITQQLYTDTHKLKGQLEFSEKGLRTIKLALDDLKSSEFQTMINSLNVIKEKLTKVEVDEAVTLSEKQLSTDLDQVVVGGNSNIKHVKVSHNDKEIFVVYSMKNLQDVHPSIYFATPDSVRSDATNRSLILKNFLTIELKYVADRYKSSELVKANALIDEMEYQTETLETIKLELDATNLKAGFYQEVRKAENDYNKEVATLVQETIGSLKIEQTDVQYETQLLVNYTQQLQNISEKYKPLFDAAVTNFDASLKAFDQAGKEKAKTYVGVNAKDKAYGDEKGVAGVMKLVSGYSSADKQSANDLNNALEVFNSNIYGYMYFEKPLNVGLRISVEGNFLYKMLGTDNVDQKDNFQVNASPSGDKGIRIVPNSTDSAFMMTLSTIGNAQLLYVFIAFILLFVLLFFINRKWFNKAFTLFFLLLISAIVIYPVIWIIGSSFNKGTSLLSVGISPFPKDMSLLQYERLFKTTNYVNWYLNTFKIAVLNMTFSVLLTVSTAYVFSRFKFKGKKVGMMAMLILQVFPSFLGMVAIYILLSRITMFSAITGTNSLIDTHLGLLLVYACGQIPYNTWLVKGYFDTIPMSLDEAARIDGASHMQAFWKVILPLGKPIISFVAITNFMGPWMDFIFPRLILKTPEKKTLAMGLYEMINGQSNNRFTMFAAGAVLVAVPITALFSYFQKFIVTGLASGAVKE